MNIAHRIRIKTIASSTWTRPSSMRAGVRIKADAYQWVCSCNHEGPERTTKRAASKGGSMHLAAMRRQEEQRRAL